VTMNTGLGPDDAESPALMLILDVKTRWSSTHQMLCEFVSSIFTINGTNSTIGRALDYCPAIDAFVGRKRELRDLEISKDEWNSIKMVATWLKSFRSATTQMSATKTPMLSTTHAVFRGLQDDLRTILRDLPSSVSLSIKKGLTDAHRKLSDYYYKYDESCSDF
jgi:hypothetical protein